MLFSEPPRSRSHRVCFQLSSACNFTCKSFVHSVLFWWIHGTYNIWTNIKILFIQKWKFCCHWNPYDIFFCVEHKRRDLVECSRFSFLYNESEWTTHSLSPFFPFWKNKCASLCRMCSCSVIQILIVYKKNISDYFHHCFTLEYTFKRCTEIHLFWCVY